MKIYGTKQCPDTMECLAACDKAGVPYEFKDITELPVLKEFLGYRDREPLYDEVRARGGVGIPLIVKDDGALSFDWTPLL